MRGRKVVEDEWEEVETDVSYAEEWARQMNDPARSAWLTSMGIVVFVQRGTAIQDRVAYWHLPRY